MSKLRAGHMVKQGFAGNGEADQGTQRGLEGDLSMTQNPIDPDDPIVQGAWESILEYDRQQLARFVERMKER